MRLTDIAEATVSAIITRLLKRAVIIALAGALAIVTLYYASAAGTLALAGSYGLLNAYLIMAGIYAALAAIAVIVFYATRPKPVLQAEQNNAAGLMSSPRNMQIAMLVEAVMLGYTLARKSTNKSIL